MAVALRKLQNSISMLQTGDALLGEVGNILGRMSDLAIQAADAPSTAADRKTMHATSANLMVGKLARPCRGCAWWSKRSHHWRADAPVASPRRQRRGLGRRY